MVLAQNIAVLIPCYNEGLTIGKVVREFRKALPGCLVYVGDNNSQDESAEAAAAAGALVIPVGRQGKGAVVRHLLRMVEAEIYVLVDGDDTYPAEDVDRLISPVANGSADMVVGDRRSAGAYNRENKRRWHGLGNEVVTLSINTLFSVRLRDIMSGYRVFSREFIKNFAVLSDGFELETALTLHAVDRRFNIVEVPVEYRDRPLGSVSKLSTYSDGFRVLRTIVWVFKDSKPLIFFIAMSLLFALVAVALVVVPLLFSHLAQTVRELWWALAGLSAVASMLSVVCGFVLDTLVKLHRENYELTLMSAAKEVRSEEKVWATNEEHAH